METVGVGEPAVSLCDGGKNPCAALPCPVMLCGGELSGHSQALNGHPTVDTAEATCPGLSSHNQQDWTLCHDEQTPQPASQTPSVQGPQLPGDLASSALLSQGLHGVGAGVTGTLGPDWFCSHNQDVEPSGVRAQSRALCSPWCPWSRSSLEKALRLPASVGEGLRVKKILPPDCRSTLVLAHLLLLEPLW